MLVARNYQSCLDFYFIERIGKNRAGKNQLRENDMSIILDKWI